MGRLWKQWRPDLVAGATVAPHRYLYAGTILADGSPAKDLDLCDNYKERRTNFPYVEGEVIYIENFGKAVKALIVHTKCERNSYTDEIREYYIVLPETAKGQWSKLWQKVHPGFVQRGYQKAGLAPDVK